MSICMAFAVGAVFQLSLREVYGSRVGSRLVRMLAPVSLAKCGTRNPTQRCKIDRKKKDGKELVIVILSLLKTKKKFVFVFS